MILTVDQVAERFQLSTKTVYRALERRSLRAAKFGSAWRIRSEDADAWFEASMPEPGAPPHARPPSRAATRRLERGSFRSLLDNEESAA